MYGRTGSPCSTTFSRSAIAISCTTLPRLSRRRRREGRARVERFAGARATLPAPVERNFEQAVCDVKQLETALRASKPKSQSAKARRKPCPPPIPSTGDHKLPAREIVGTVSVRVTTEDRDLWQTAAGERRLSDWVRDSLNDIAAAAVRRSKPKP